MAFPPQFLDELRGRLSISGVVGRQVKLQKRGREYLGLCPFHKEKTPSFTVAEDKGFFHCFGCGAHGDVIGFVMRADGLGFPEAVERLAAEAGLEVPKTTPEERRKAERAGGLYALLEAACRWFEECLRKPEGREARSYLTGRGLDEDTMARFRLGFAPDRRDGIQVALRAQDFSESELIEGGLVARPDDGRPPYDRFRGRVIFPITDRRGRIVGFGGRLLAAREGAAKYLNSPDGPLFHKGRLLYALDKAQAAAREGNDVIVAEGYTDVIALHRAGFKGAVAPLGTALTESQIDLLWRLAPEPVLCFDGDEAGQRAAARAAERALPLVDVVWQSETAGRPADTPERRARLREALRQRAYAIADRTVQDYYLAEFEARLERTLGGPRGRRWRGGRRAAAEAGAGAPGLRTHGNVGVLMLRQQQLLLATVVNHPALLAEAGEDLGMVKLADPALDKLRQEIIKTQTSGVDTGDVRSHLIEQGFSGLLGRLLSEEVYAHGGFARPGADLERARRGWRQLFDRYHRRPQFGAEIDAAVRALAEEPTDQNRIYLERLREQHLRADEVDWGDEETDRAVPAASPDG